jgi:hypothetical protein
MECTSIATFKFVMSSLLKQKGLICAAFPHSVDIHSSTVLDILGFPYPAGPERSKGSRET